GDACAACATVAAERDGPRLVGRTGELLTICPWAAAGPFEGLLLRGAPPPPRPGRPPAGRPDRRAAPHLPLGVGGPLRGPAAPGSPPSPLRGRRRGRRRRHGRGPGRPGAAGLGGWRWPRPPPPR